MEKRQNNMMKQLSFVLVILFALFLMSSTTDLAYASNGLGVASDTIEYNNSKENAEEITLKNGLISNLETKIYSGEDLWYKFKIVENVEHKIKLSTYDNGTTVSLDLFDENLNLIKTINGSASTADVENLVGKLNVGKWYFAKLNLNVGANNNRSTTFLLSIGAVKYQQKIILNKVTFNGTQKSGKNYINLKWNKQAPATKYQVRYKAESGKYVTKTTTKTNLKLTKLKAKTTYKVNIRAYCKGAYKSGGKVKSDWGDWSVTKSIKTKK